LFFDGINEIWIPRSQVLEINQVELDAYQVIIPEWLAIKKEII